MLLFSRRALFFSFRTNTAAKATNPIKPKPPAAAPIPIIALCESAVDSMFVGNLVGDNDGDLGVLAAADGDDVGADVARHGRQ
jgi:hypothetical protein